MAQQLLHCPQVAVFDTAFHATMPPHAFTYGIPYSLYKELGIRRYGFHGTSYAYLLQEAARFLNKPEKDVNMIAFHLGAGASVAAVKQVCLYPAWLLPLYGGWSPGMPLFSPPLSLTRSWGWELIVAMRSASCRRYAYLLQKAARFLKKPEKDVKMIAFNLGAGASVAGVKQVRLYPAWHLPLYGGWCPCIPLSFSL